MGHWKVFELESAQLNSNQKTNVININLILNPKHNTVQAFVELTLPQLKPEQWGSHVKEEYNCL